MIHQPPAGARDLLPLEVEQKCWINDCLQAVFQQWGYQRIVTSTIEWLDTLMAGGAVERKSVIQLQETAEGVLGLRPELTASIARTAVTRMAGNTYPQRICYRANVFRNPPSSHHGRQLEFYQAGVELLFAGGVLADAEILLLAANCLQNLGIPQWHIILGDADLTRSLLSLFPVSLQQQIGYCLANLDYVTLEKLPYPSQQLREKALFLFDLRGNPSDVIQKVVSLNLESSAQEHINNLKSLIELINQSSEQPLPLTLDLSLVQNFDYYTGIVFKVVSLAENQLQILGQGGRYDQLLGLYDPQHQSAPGIGFSLNIESLHISLLASANSDLPTQTPALDWLVIPQTPAAEAQAFQYAQQLRNSQNSVRVAVDLGGRSPAEIREYARSCRISHLVWIPSAGNPVIEAS